MRYDDGDAEWLQLDAEQLRWHTPRGRSAGYRPKVHSLALQLGVKGLRPEMAPDQPDSRPELGGEPPASAADAVGRRLSVYWQGDGRWYAAEVLAHNARSGRHHLLYADGEDEWVDLRVEVVAWARPQRERGAASTAIGVNEGRRGGRERGGASVAARLAGAWRLHVCMYVCVGGWGRAELEGGQDGGKGRPASQPGRQAGRHRRLLLQRGARGGGRVGQPGTLPCLVLAAVQLQLDPGMHVLTLACGAVLCLPWACLPAGQPIPQGRAAVGWRVSVYWQKVGRGVWPGQACSRSSHCGMGRRVLASVTGGRTCVCEACTHMRSRASRAMECQRPRDALHALHALHGMARDAESLDMTDEPMTTRALAVAVVVGAGRILLRRPHRVV